MENNTLSRRHAFKIVGLTGAAVALRGTAVYAEEAAATPPATQGAGFYRTMVGEFEVTIVSDGFFPFGAPFPTFGANATQAEVEQVLKDAFLDPAKLAGQVNTLIVRKAGGPVMVIDTGCGGNFGPTAGFSVKNLAVAGVKPADVQSVLLTHLHPDHAGGVAGPDGKAVFANAKHYTHKIEKDFWTSATPDFSKSGVPEAMQPVMIGAAGKAIAGAGSSLTTFDGETSEIAPGITAVLTGGHTPGHCAVKIESNGESLLYVTDLIVQSVIVPAHPEWFVGFDTDREKTVEVRKALFAKLAEEKTLICGSHLPFPSLGHLKKAGTGYEFVPSPWRWA
ncbi:MAG: putative hydrolase [Phycisphaerales bacterium]|nr:putative hydrolase [Phycisphaerales bacterium]